MLLHSGMIVLDLGFQHQGLYGSGALQGSHQTGWQRWLWQSLSRFWLWGTDDWRGKEGHSWRGKTEKTDSVLLKHAHQEIKLSKKKMISWNGRISLDRRPCHWVSEWLTFWLQKLYSFTQTTCEHWTIDWIFLVIVSWWHWHRLTKLSTSSRIFFFMLFTFHFVCSLLWPQFGICQKRLKIITQSHLSHWIKRSEGKQSHFFLQQNKDIFFSQNIHL